MNVAPKLQHTQLFTEGINTVLSPRYMSNKQARRIRNCNSLTTSAGLIGSLSNVKGNLLLYNELPAGYNETIGVAVDSEANNLYYFNYNSNKYHGIYRFNTLDKSIVPVILNLTDTGGKDILRFSLDYPIFHADVVRNELLYWVDGLNPARKTNIKRCMDKSATGYGQVIREEFISAYKQAPIYSAIADYIDDTTKPFNRLYGRLYKFIYRFVYIDGERSNWSDFGNVPLPLGEPITGITSIPTKNNGIRISVETGSLDVKQIEIAMQSTAADVGEDGLLNFQTIAVLDKRILAIPDDSTYSYNFYHDASYFPTDMAKVRRPHSYLPLRPRCQAFVQNALCYFNFYEGFSPVEVETEVTVAYNDLFIDPGIENKPNTPKFERTEHSVAYIRGDGGNRETTETILVGPDVKKGNKFNLRIYSSSNSGGIPLSIDFNKQYEATSFDTAQTVANWYRARVIEWDPIKDNSVSGVESDANGNAWFSYTVRWFEYAEGTPTVQPVNVSTLKDTGQSVNNTKLGSSIKLGIEYEDGDGRKSLVYTNDALIVGIKTINELGGFKKPVITLKIKHRPPIWARYYQVMRSKDLVYGDYIQILVQDVSTVQATATQNNGDYLDLVVGSLFTYQRLHENTVLSHEFKTGDRIRLISHFDKISSAQTYYPFYESEVLSYREYVETKRSDNVTTVNGSAEVTVGEAFEDNVNKIIIINGVERTIVSRPTATKYVLDREMTEDKKYPDYTIVDRRGTIRIRKPPVSIIPELKDLSLIEIYTPSLNLVNEGSRSFFGFTEKYPIINPGTEQRAHGGASQNQDGTSEDSLKNTPAILLIDNGTAYIRNRELPITNVIPGAQILIGSVEDPNYSDFYQSKLNDNGRVNIQDTGDGEVHFGSRGRPSNNFIEGTRINGLNDFDSSDRKDYNDQYGDFMLTVVDQNRIFAFKQLKDTWIPIKQRVITQGDGTPMLTATNDLLNDIQYFAHEGGIGNNPESYASMGTSKYHISANSGVVIRIGGNGAFPISEAFDVDNEVRSRLKDAERYGTKIPGGCDPENGLYVFSIKDYEKDIFNSGFSESYFETIGDELPLNTEFQIFTYPTHGGLAFNGNNYQLVYTPHSGFIGTDEFKYRAKIDGVWSEPQLVSIAVTSPFSRPSTTVSVSTVQNVPVMIDLPSDWALSGWSMSNGLAFHSATNPGILSFKTEVPDGSYRITYEVFDRKSGQVYVMSGGNVKGDSHRTNGVFGENIEIVDGKIQFFADGELRIKSLAITPLMDFDTDNSFTFAFHEKSNKWVTEYDYKPDLMCRFINSFFTFKSGEIWEHNVNPIRNSFYGVKYKSSVTFYINNDPSAFKEYSVLAVESNAIWSAPNNGDIKILPHKENPIGMRSRIKQKKFKNYGETWCADFLRNIDDPRYGNQDIALMFGAHLQGKIMEMTLENDDDDEVLLDSVTVFSDKIISF